MKQSCKKLLLLVLSVLLLFGTLATASAADTEPAADPTPASDIDYDDLFERSLHSDGAYTEAACAELAQAYLTDTEGLFAALSLCPPEELDKHADHLVYGMNYHGLDEFRAEIDAMAAESTAYSNVMTAILNALDRWDEWRNAPSGSEENVEPPAPSHPFAADILLHFIELNETSGNLDTEYFHTLGNAFRSDPAYFMEILRGRSEASLEKIAKGVVYDCLNHSSVRSLAEVVSDTEVAEEDNLFYNMLAAAFRDPARESLEVFREHPLQTPSAKSTYIPSIGVMSYTTEPLVVGTMETLSVTFMEVLHTDVTRAYYAEVYCVRNGTAWYKSGRSFWISAGSTSQQVLFPFEFSSTGDVYTLVKVYSSEGGTLLNSRQGSSPDTIYGYWSIDIVLPANRNNKGTLKLRDASGVELLSCECLGLSVSNDSMTTYEGNTPTGTYTGYLYGPVDPSGSYGPYKVINMTGVSGVIISSGRSGIWIHGGNPEPDTTKPNYPLQATHGCVRVTNSNQLTLQNLITNLISSEDHYTTGNISISQS